MDRRHFLNTTASGLATIYLVPWTVNTHPKTDALPKAHVLSSQGCGRATGYAEANKIISLADKTHVTWLDSSLEGFKVMIKTYDHTTKEWSPSYFVGKGYDNHGGAALTLDSQGYLHIVYYPHHHEMRYRRSTHPNDASAWEAEIPFGEKCTYPTLVCGPDDTLYFTCRRSFDEKEWQAEFWKKPPNQAWVGPIPILQSQYISYAHFQESLAWGPDQKSLHLACRIHEKSDDGAYGRIQTVGYMKTNDYGKSWTTSNGQSLRVPLNSASIEQLATGGLDAGRILRCGAMAVDQNDNAHMVYSIQEGNKGLSFLEILYSSGERKKVALNTFLPGKYQDWDLIMPGGVCFNTQNELFISAQIQKPESFDTSWGHPSTEIVLFHSRDHAKSFTCELVSSPDPEVPNWLPSIERPTGHNVIKKRPVISYTSGKAGGGNKDLLANRVYCLIS